MTLIAHLIVAATFLLAFYLLATMPTKQKIKREIENQK
jgi:hypothetical protein